jgi:hypothetical protein
MSPRSDADLVLLWRNGILSHDHTPEQNEETDREQQVYISRRVSTERHNRPDGEHDDRCDDANVHFKFVDG